jgi:pyruvate,water dikinase
VLHGIAASGGVATGRARVTRTLEEGAALQPGEVLIAPFTDPGWTPLFAVAAAVVTDLGGVLSHGAIVAREYGIPAVVNTRHATARIRTGQIVTVDGNTGTVRIAD